MGFLALKYSEANLDPAKMHRYKARVGRRKPINCSNLAYSTFEQGISSRCRTRFFLTNDGALYQVLTASD